MLSSLPAGGADAAGAACNQGSVVQEPQGLQVGPTASHLKLHTNCKGKKQRDYAVKHDSREAGGGGEVGGAPSLQWQVDWLGAEHVGWRLIWCKPRRGEGGKDRRALEMKNRKEKKSKMWQDVWFGHLLVLGCS